MIGLAAPVAYYFATPGGDQEAARLSYAFRLVDYHPLVRLPEFLIGVVLGHLYLKQRSVRYLPPAGLMAGVILAIIVLGDGLPLLLLGNGLLAPIVAVLIFQLAARAGWLSRALAQRPLVLLGEASYAMYLLHVPLHAWLRPVGLRLTGSDAWLLTPWYVAIYRPSEKELDKALS